MDIMNFKSCHWFDKRIGGIYGPHESEAAFQLIKQKLCSAPILALPEGSKDFIIYCDALIKGLGNVLMQREKERMRATIKSLSLSHDYWLGSSQTNLECSDGSTKTKEHQERKCKRYDQEGYTKGEVGTLCGWNSMLE
ncbi:putative reverse transcriptase domain-containing protein [Tanacetum coccineum]